MVDQASRKPQYLLSGLVLTYLGQWCFVIGEYYLLPHQLLTCYVSTSSLDKTCPL